MTTPITKEQLTDERPDDESLEILITLRREIAERHAKEGHMAQCAVHTVLLNALLELQERRKAATDAEPVIIDLSGELSWEEMEYRDEVIEKLKAAGIAYKVGE